MNCRSAIINSTLKQPSFCYSRLPTDLSSNNLTVCSRVSSWDGQNEEDRLYLDVLFPVWSTSGPIFLISQAALRLLFVLIRCGIIYPSMLLWYSISINVPTHKHRCLSMMVFRVGAIDWPLVGWVCLSCESSWKCRYFFD